MLKNNWESNEGKWYTHPRIFNFWSQTLGVHPLHPQRSSCLLSWANIPDPENHTWSLPHSFFFYFPLHLPSAALRFVSFNPVMSSSASVTEYNHLCALIQPRVKMLGQFEQGGRASEREGGKSKRKLWESMQQENEKVRANRGSCHSSAATSCVGDARYLLFHTQ